MVVVGVDLRAKIEMGGEDEVGIVWAEKLGRRDIVVGGRVAGWAVMVGDGLESWYALRERGGEMTRGTELVRGHESETLMPLLRMTSF